MSPREPERPFEAPWHAELFAATHALAQAGAFSWPDWTAWFGAAIARADATGAPRDGSNYYEIWLEALEEVLRRPKKVVYPRQKGKRFRLTDVE